LKGGEREGRGEKAGVVFTELEKSGTEGRLGVKVYTWVTWASFHGHRAARLKLPGGGPGRKEVKRTVLGNISLIRRGFVEQGTTPALFAGKGRKNGLEERVKEKRGGPDFIGKEFETGERGRKTISSTRRKGKEEWCRKRAVRMPKGEVAKRWLDHHLATALQSRKVKRKEGGSGQNGKGKM